MSFFEFPHTRNYDSDLGWLIKTMHEVLDNVEAQNAAIEMYKQWTEEHVTEVERVAADLRNFVNTYFDNLDVQQEINSKINDMAADGSLLTLLQPPISVNVADWLAENITPTTPAVDASLTIAGAAADAKAAGDRISAIEPVATALSNDVLINGITYETEKCYQVRDGALTILTGPTYGTFHSAIISVDPGDVIVYSGRCYNYQRQYSLIAVDDENNVYKYALNVTTDSIINDYLFSIPENATKLIVQSYLSNPTIKKREYLQRTDLQLEYDNGIRSISRAGYNGPKNALYSFKNAYKEGFRILLGDLRFTSDNVPVLFHDTYINQNYINVYNANGTLVSTDPAINIADIPFSQFNTYKYGETIYGTLTFFPMCNFRSLVQLCKYLGCELYVELKTAITSEQAQILTRMVRSYGMADKTSWCADRATTLAQIVSKLPTARVGTMPATIDDSRISAINAIDNGKIKKFFFSYSTTELNGPIVDKLMANNIEFEIGSINNETALRNYYNQSYAYQYCTGIESDLILPGRVLLHDMIV